MDAEAKLDKEIALVDLVQIRHELAEDSGSPDRLEITEHGEIVGSPAPENRHQMVIAALTKQLLDQLGAWVLSEPSVLTQTAGIRRPDVAWLREDRAAEALASGPMAVVPPLVGEVLSPGNRKGEMARKIRGYLQSGAQELIVVALDGGTVTFHRNDGIHPESVMGLSLTLPAELFG